MVKDAERFYTIASQAYYWLQDAWECALDQRFSDDVITEEDANAVYAAMDALEKLALTKEPDPLPAWLEWKEKKKRQPAAKKKEAA